jgi:hypothetical protein
VVVFLTVNGGVHVKILRTLAAILVAALPGIGGPFTSTFQDVGFPGGTFTQLLGTLTSVPNIPIAAPMSQATGLNNLGSSSGIFAGGSGTHGFPTEGTIFTTLDAGPAAFTQALGVNSEKEVVGFYNDSLGNANGLSSWLITGLGVLAIGLLIRRSAR